MLYCQKRRPCLGNPPPSCSAISPHTVAASTLSLPQASTTPLFQHIIDMVSSTALGVARPLLPSKPPTTAPRPRGRGLAQIESLGARAWGGALGWASARKDFLPQQSGVVDQSGPIQYFSTAGTEPQHTAPEVPGPGHAVLRDRGRDPPTVAGIIRYSC